MGAILIVFFFFQAEDGIRDVAVTGVQTCALPISGADADLEHALARPAAERFNDGLAARLKDGAEQRVVDARVAAVRRLDGLEVHARDYYRHVTIVTSHGFEPDGGGFRLAAEAQGRRRREARPAAHSNEYRGQAWCFRPRKAEWSWRLRHYVQRPRCAAGPGHARRRRSLAGEQHSCQDSRHCFSSPCRSGWAAARCTNKPWSPRSSWLPRPTPASSSTCATSAPPRSRSSPASASCCSCTARRIRRKPPSTCR